MNIFNINGEINLIDDSAEIEITLIKNWCESYGFNYHFYAGSISQKRNEAIRISSKEIVLFIDSDCYLKKGVVNTHLMSYSESNIDAVLGVVEFTGPKPFFWRIILQSGFTIPFNFARFMDYATWGPCANISFRKQLIPSIGWFKEQFPFDYSGEDVDIGIRLNKSGSKIWCCPDAIVFHDTQTWLKPWPFIKKIFRWGRTDYHLMTAHNEMLYPEFLKFPFILLILGIFGLFKGIGIAFISIILLAVPVFMWLFESARTYRFESDLTVFFASFYLKQVFEVGLMYESFIHFRFNFISKKILYSPRQLQFEIGSRVSYSLAILLSVFICLYLLSMTRGQN